MDNCIFCKIIAGEIPAYKVYEDDQVLAFLDIHPVSTGHTLLIPKNHYEWMQDVPDDVLAYSFLKTKNLMKSLKENLNCDYIQISVVGKDVPHFHIHLMPRMLTDGLTSFPTLTLEKNRF
jgi:histidine triad (HIT) family protein